MCPGCTRITYNLYECNCAFCMYFATLQTGASLHSTVSVGQEKKTFFHTILNTFSVHLNGSCGQECTHAAQTGGSVTNTLQGSVIMVETQEWDYGSAGL